MTVQMELSRIIISEINDQQVVYLKEVEGDRTFPILDWYADEVSPLDSDHPTEPSIWSWISRFISTAYSSGSSFVIGSTKPETIIALASASERPRLIR